MMPSFIQALIVFCMSYTGAPQPPWLACRQVTSPVVAFQPSGIRPGEDLSYAMGRQCRMALKPALARDLAEHPDRDGWWVAGVNCLPISPRQMG